MITKKAKLFIRECLPPIILRKIIGSRFLIKNYSNLIKGEEQDDTFYDKSFLNYEHFRRHYTESSYFPIWTMIADRICHSRVSSILDIGCGPGQVAQLLRDKGIQKYLGIDFSSERIKHAKRICPEFDFVQTDVFKSDLLSNSHYDGVICLEFLEHVDRDVQVIEALRPGARFWGSVPNFGAKQHVRYFHNCEEVIERYGNYFADFKVDEHLANTLGAKFFVIEGIVK